MNCFLINISRDLTDRMSVNPRKIFNLPQQDDTYIEVDLNEEWTIPQKGGQSKAGWTPFAGRKIVGKVHNVVIRGEEVFVDGRVSSSLRISSKLSIFRSSLPQVSVKTSASTHIRMIILERETTSMDWML